MKGMRVSYEDQFRIEYFCGLIEYIARKTHLHRSEVISYFNDEDIAWQLRVAEVNSNLWPEQVSDELIEHFDIKKGDYNYDPKVCNTFEFDTVGTLLKTCAIALIEQEGMAAEDAIREVIKTPLYKFLHDIE